MIAEILSTGDEIRSGALIDSNSAHIARKLEEIGIEVVRHNCVGDQLDLLVGILREIGNRCDIAVVTGGLGPTRDDLSAQAASDAADAALEFSDAAMASVKAFFKGRKYTMSRSNEKQAMLPRGAECLQNPVGTAPGFGIKIGRCIFYFLPGVPFEMRKMLRDQVMPRIEQLQGSKSTSRVRTISTFGLPESAVGEKIDDLNGMFSEIKVGLRASFPEIQIKLYGRSADAALLDRQLGRAEKFILDKIGEKVFSVDGEAMETVVGRILRKKGASLAVAESCTGGLIANQLTEVPGSSDYFLFSGVTYANEAKVQVLGVSADTLKNSGAVDEQTALEMAVGARKIAGATYGLSTTGIAGPGGGTPEKPVGTVCIGLAGPRGATARRHHFPFGRRRMNKRIFAMTALDQLRRALLGIGDAGKIFGNTK